MSFGVFCLIIFIIVIISRAQTLLSNQVISPTEDAAYDDANDFCGFLIALSTLAALSVYHFPHVFTFNKSESTTKTNASKTKMPSEKHTDRSVIEEKNVEEIIMDLQKEKSNNLKDVE